MNPVRGLNDRRSILASSVGLFLLAGPVLAARVAQVDEWPAESEESAANLSGTNAGFQDDLSGAVWNPATRALWLCRNGPGKDSRLWALEPDGLGGLRVLSDGDRLAEWSGLGDSEGVTFADYEEAVVYLVVEGEEAIHELDVSTYGRRVLRQVYDTSPYLPLEGSAGAEGITFVPDEYLERAGFVDASGSVRTSRLGMGGLMLVGHQNGGGIFAFDLDPTSGAVELAGEYRVLPSSPEEPTPLSRVVALEFDRSTAELFVWHGLRDANLLSIVPLASVPVPGESFRAFADPRIHRGPSGRSYEGLALAPIADCRAGARDLYLTVDDGGAHSLFRYGAFRGGCVSASTPSPDAAPTQPADSPDPWKMLFSLVGGLGLFLVGMKHMSEGMQAIAGKRLRQMINAVTDNRFLAVAVGAGVTCFVQSSSITTVIVVGFVNSGLMNLAQAIGVIMGANIGTTITGWILVLKIGKYGLPLLGLSAFAYLFAKRDRLRYVAMALMGLGMIFFGLELMKNGVKPMRSIPAFQEAFAWFSADSYVGVLKCAALGCALTFLVQSSSATLGITISLGVTGTIPFETAAALVLGENVGTTITAWLASLGATTAAKRAAYAHVAFNLIGVFWITLAFGGYIRIVGRFISWETGVDVLASDFVPENSALAYGTVITLAIATTHTIFNVANTLLFLAFVPRFAALLERWVPDRRGQESPRLALGKAGVSSPVLSVGHSHRAISAMAGEVEEMLAWTRELLASDRPTRDLADRVFAVEARMDDGQAEVIRFLTDLLTAETPHQTANEARQQLRAVDEYESVSDYVSTILKARLRLDEHGLRLCPAERERLLALHDEVVGYLRQVTRAFQDPGARDLPSAIRDSDLITRAVKELRSAHLNSLSEGRVDPVLSMSYSAMLNGYRKVKDHALNIAESLAVT